MLSSLTFLTPRAGLVAFAVLLPVTALVVGGARVRRARAVLHLPEPSGGLGRWRPVAVISVPLLIALALAQPAWRRHGSLPTRTDAGVFVVIDTSNSMAAAASSHAPSRLEQAKRIALAAGSQLPGIPLGVATFTDRVLPDAFPTADRAIFDSTVRALRIDGPPPRETARVATDFSALAALQRADFFTRAQTHRAVLLITDGETAAFDAGAVARAFAAAPRAHLVIVRVGGAGDRLHADGRAAGGYRADTAGARRAVAQLAAATDGRALSGSGAAGALRSALGTGSTTAVASAPTTWALGPLVALIGLVPLLFALTTTEDLSRLTRRFT